MQEHRIITCPHCHGEIAVEINVNIEAHEVESYKLPSDTTISYPVWHWWGSTDGRQTSTNGGL